MEFNNSQYHVSTRRIYTKKNNVEKEIQDARRKSRQVGKLIL